MECVAIFRHPQEVAQSLKIRDGISLDEGINLWKTYNRRLLDWHSQLNFPIIEFSHNSAGFKKGMGRLIKSLNLPWEHSIDKLSFYQHEHYHNRHAHHEGNSEEHDIYHQLVSRSNQCPSELVLGSNTVESSCNKMAIF